MPATPTKDEATSATITEHELQQCRRANATGRQPVVFVHGLGGRWQNWLENLPVFARHFRTFIVDLPGYGGSAPVEGNPMQISADAIIRFMDALKLCIRSTSLGDVFTSVLHPATASHRDLSPGEHARRDTQRLVPSEPRDVRCCLCRGRPRFFRGCLPVSLRLRSAVRAPCRSN